MSNNGKSIKPHERLLVYLHHCAGNAFASFEGYAHNMSVGAINESITMCNHLINEYIYQKYVNFPTEEEARMEARLFAGKKVNDAASGNTHWVKNFPEVMPYVIDGMHVWGEILRILYSIHEFIHIRNANPKVKYSFKYHCTQLRLHTSDFDFID